MKAKKQKKKQSVGAKIYLKILQMNTYVRLRMAYGKWYGIVYCNSEIEKKKIRKSGKNYN